MRRKIVKIDHDKCNGCGLCVSACAERALQLVDGKAMLVSESYCDGLGACLPGCPVGAITIEERDARAFDAEAVEEHTGAAAVHAAVGSPHGHGCPGAAVRTMARREPPARTTEAREVSQLTQWPVQLMLVPPGAAFLAGADILVCADCVPFALADFHSRYLGGRAVLVGCPKFDDLALYREKLKEIIAAAEPRSLTVVRMEVPCCGGIARAVVEARDAASLDLPVTVATVGINGEVLSSESA